MQVLAIASTKQIWDNIRTSKQVAKMHIHGRSEIMDRLHASKSHEPSYDIRSLSHELLLRSDGKSIAWTNDDQAIITLIPDNEGRYEGYELYVQEKNDTDTHRYVYNAVAKTIRYEYPILTWHPKQNLNQLVETVESLLLSGPLGATSDKVSGSDVERSIQRIFPFIAGRLVLERLDEYEPSFKADRYAKYILSDTPEAKQTIIYELYDTVVELGFFSIGPEQFENIICSDIASYQLQQKQLPQKASSTDQPESY